MDVLKWEGKVDLAIRKHARRQPPDVKDDLRQECFLALIKAEKEIEASDDPGAFAYRVARTTILDAFKTTLKKQDSESLDDPDVSSKLEASPAPSKDPLLEELPAVVSKLPEIERFVIRACYFDGKTEDDVARDLGRSRDWVQRTKQSALGKVRALLKEK